MSPFTFASASAEPCPSQQRHSFSAQEMPSQDKQKFKRKAACAGSGQEYRFA